MGEGFRPGQAASPQRRGIKPLPPIGPNYRPQALAALVGLLVLAQAYLFPRVVP